MRQHQGSLVLVVGLASLLLPLGARAQSALGQLGAMCRDSGANCNTNVPDVPTPILEPPSGGQQAAAPQRAVVKPAPPPSAGQQLALGLAGGLVEGLLSSLLAPEPSGPSPEELAAQERQRIAEFQARAAVVSQQRVTRDAQLSTDMESMAASMSAGWDRPADVAPLGGSEPVRLHGTTPSLFAPPSNPLTPPVPPPSLAGQRLAQLSAENADVAKLTSRLGDLSAELDAARKDADLIGRKSHRRTEEYQQMEQTVAQGVSDAWDRGMSLAFDGLFTANAKALGRLSEVQSNSRAFGELKSMLQDAQRGAEFLKDSSEKAEQLSEDVSFVRREREFKEDVAWLAERLGGKYTELGQSILASSRTVRDELEVLHRQGELQGFERQYQAQLERVKVHMDKLIGEIGKVRRELSLRTGIAEKDIQLPAPPRPPGAFGTEPPPVPAE
jgi:hypothetical protein